MTVLQSSISQTGIAMPATLVSPLQKAHAEEEDADELLPVLRAVHEAHRGRARKSARI